MHTAALDTTSNLVNLAKICATKSIPHEKHHTACSKQFGCKPSLPQCSSTHRFANSVAVFISLSFIQSMHYNCARSY